MDLASFENFINISVSYLLDNGKWVLTFGETVIELGELSPAVIEAFGTSLGMLSSTAPFLIVAYSSWALGRERVARESAERRAEDANKKEREAREREREAHEREREAQERGDDLESEIIQGHSHVIPLPVDAIQELRRALGLGGNETVNIACVGRVSSGKTSFINSCRGLHQRSQISDDTPPEHRPGRVGVEETTRERTKYVHRNRPDFTFWDMPGTGGRNQREWTYYQDYNLGIYDCLLVLHDMPFSQTECNIVKMHQQQVERQKNPPRLFIVRTKADASLRNKRRDSDLRWDELVKEFKNDNVRSVQEFLAREDLNSAIPIYHISSDALYTIATGETPGRRGRVWFLDELNLMRDLGLEVTNAAVDPDFVYDSSPDHSEIEDVLD